MTKAEAISYIENHTWSTTRLGLERTYKLLDALGNPQKRLKFVHVAGSNGKGSTCAMLESVLRQAGYKTGLYTSPHIQDFCERIQFCGEYIPDERLAEITERVGALADRMDDHPSQFELVTAIAMAYFEECKCDIVVLETGLGGKLDSTNAIDAPEVAVITNIGLEHTEYLGNTLQEIARAKAGIIKPGCHAVCYDCAPEVLEVIDEICKSKKVPMHFVDCSQISQIGRDLTGQRFLWREQPLFIPLLGGYQIHNAALVIECVLALTRRGWHISEEDAKNGLANVKWPARFEILSKDPLFILDGGHNPQCAKALAAVLGSVLPGKKFIFIMGALADKNYHEMIDAIVHRAAGFICLTPDSPRALPAACLADEISKRYKLPVTACDSPAQAVSESLKQGWPVVAFGSLYMAGSIRGAFPVVYRRA